MDCRLLFSIVRISLVFFLVSINFTADSQEDFDQFFSTEKNTEITESKTPNIEANKRIAESEARRHAEKDIDTFTWTAAGCLFNINGIFWAYQFGLPKVSVMSSKNGDASIVEDYSHPDRLLGKTPQYAVAYTQAYRKKAREIRVNSAVGGCLASIAVPLIIYLVSQDKL